MLSEAQKAKGCLAADLVLLVSFPLSLQQLLVKRGLILRAAEQSKPFAECGMETILAIPWVAAGSLASLTFRLNYTVCMGYGVVTEIKACEQKEK